MNRHSYLTALLIMFALVLLTGCMDLRIELTVDKNGNPSELSIRASSDERLFINMAANQFVEWYDTIRQDGHDAYVFLEIDDTSPPYSATMTFDYSEARRRGFSSVHGLWEVMDVESDDDSIVVSYDFGVQDEPSDSGDMSHLISMTIVTSMPGEVETYSGGFLDRTRRVHTYRGNLAEPITYSVSSKKPGLWR